eukprot:CAMPEP_0185457686 /NCGR_PEP_ID=MMETSP1365-20130426/80587_1 /TAXON_ID=38817 /ORGANISM="Gephyrocapsa oceanica, Strain RCC1303" /LENGTH=90 /DNA_ID=CAMNT_0028064155 /DNA_START=123 /DNA_END=395 /DNA_ORIENTATION=-
MLPGQLPCAQSSLLPLDEGLSPIRPMLGRKEARVRVLLLLWHHGHRAGGRRKAAGRGDRSEALAAERLGPARRLLVGLGANPHIRALCGQ